MKSKSLRIRIRIHKSKNPVPSIRNVKDQKIKRQQRCHKSVSKITQPNAGNKQNAGSNSCASDSSPKVRLKNNQSQKNQSWHNRRNQRIAPIVHGLGFIFQKPGKKKNERRLSQLRRLQRHWTNMKPAMRSMRPIQKKHRDQQQRCKPEKRKYQRRMLQPFVIHLHGHNHYSESRDRPDQLLEQEFVSRSEPFLCHYRRGAENHDQSNKNQDRGHRKHPPIDANPLSHRSKSESISPRRERNKRYFAPKIPEEDNCLGSTEPSVETGAPHSTRTSRGGDSTVTSSKGTAMPIEPPPANAPPA